MHIERLYADRFRNLEAIDFEPHLRFNILEGDNGQGKTNVLEALYLLAGLRSFRTNKLAECIAFDADKAEVAARIERGGVRTDLGIELGRPRHRVLIDGKTATRSADYLGRLTLVLFTPDDLAMPHGEPGARRRYLDRVIFNHRPGYLEELRRYEQCLGQRNAMLRQANGGALDRDLLEVFDGLLAEAGAVISLRRAVFAQQFDAQIKAEFEQVAAGGLSASMRYASRLSLEEDADLGARQQALLAELAVTHDRDRRRGFTGSGPHLDDLVLLINDRPARIHASQGQCRALVLAMKIAEIRSLEAQLGEAPVLLMDDVSSELDRRRNAALMAHLDALGGQVFLTTTDAGYIALTAPRSVFVMSAGRCTSRGLPAQEDSHAGLPD